MIAGYGAAGLSGFALLAAGPRVLGQDGYTAMALAWTVITVIGYGISLPGEQVVTRRIAAGAGVGTVRPIMRRMLFATPAIVAVLPLTLDEGTSGHRSALWFTSLLAAAVASAAVAGFRGELAGGGAFGSYALLLFVEAGARLLLVIMALVIPGAGPTMLAAALAAPLILCAFLGQRWAKRMRLPADREMPEDTRLEHFSVTLVSLLIQICLSSAQFWLYQQSSDAAVSGAFVTATAYLRIPSLLAIGLYSPLLSEAAEAFADGRSRAVTRATSRALLLGGGGAAVMVALLLAFADLGMSILYGPATGLPFSTLVWLGVSTVVSIAATIVTNVLFGCSRATAAAIAWIPPALLSTALFASAGAETTRLAIAATLGQVLALALLSGILRYRVLQVDAAASREPASGGEPPGS